MNLLNGNFSKVKTFVSKNKVSIITTGVVVASQLLTITTHAATLDIVTPLTAAMNDTVTNTIACFSAIIPIALTIFGCKFAYVKSVSFFSSIATK